MTETKLQQKNSSAEQGCVVALSSEEHCHGGEGMAEQLSPWHQEADNTHPRAHLLSPFSFLKFRLRGGMTHFQAESSSVFLSEKLSTSHTKVSIIKVVCSLNFPFGIWYLYILAFVYGMVYIWRSADNLRGSVLSTMWVL